MVCQCIETGAGTSQVVGTRSLPSVVTGDVNVLIFVEGRERETTRAGLSLLICCIFWYGGVFLEVPLHEVGIFEGLLSIRAQGMSGRYCEETCEHICKLHLGV